MVSVQSLPVLNLLTANVSFGVEVLFLRRRVHQRVVCSSAIFLKEFRLKATINFSLQGNRNIFVQFLLLNIIRLSVVVLHHPFLHLEVIAYLELVLYQVLGLSKRTSELLPFFFPEAAHFSSLHDMCHLHLLFLQVEFILTILKLISENFLLKIETGKDLKVFLDLVGLLFFYDPLDFSRLLHFLPQQGFLLEHIADRLLRNS